MRYNQLLEARKNPDLNQRTDIDSEMIQYYEEEPNQFVSFTSIKKLGINPQNAYNTPTGIYCYPLSYVVEETTQGLPFAEDCPYAWVFKLQGRYLNIKEYDDFDLYDDYRTLNHILETRGLEKIAELPQIDGKHPVYHLFELVLQTAEKIQNISISREKAPPALVTTIMYKILDYNYCYDDGLGVIHQNEPTQCVVYNSQSIVDAKLVTNQTSSHHTQCVINTTGNSRLALQYSEMKTIKNGNEYVSIGFFGYHKTKRDMDFYIYIKSRTHGFNIRFNLDLNMKFDGTYDVSQYEDTTTSWKTNTTRYTINAKTPLLDIFNSFKTEDNMLFGDLVIGSEFVKYNGFEILPFSKGFMVKYKDSTVIVTQQENKLTTKGWNGTSGKSCLEYIKSVSDQNEI